MISEVETVALGGSSGSFPRDEPEHKADESDCADPSALVRDEPSSDHGEPLGVASSAEEEEPRQNMTRMRTAKASSTPPRMRPVMLSRFREDWSPGAWWGNGCWCGGTFPRRGSLAPGLPGVDCDMPGHYLPTGSAVPAQTRQDFASRPRADRNASGGSACPCVEGNTCHMGAGRCSRIGTRQAGA